MEQQSQQAKPQMVSMQSNKLSEQSKEYYLKGYEDGYKGNCINEELETDLDYVEGWSLGFSDRRDANNLIFD